MKDYVVYKKDNKKIIYEIVERKSDSMTIRGVNYRKILRVNEQDLIKATPELVEEEFKKNKMYLNFIETRQVTNKKIGTVIHFDSDYEYLNKCSELYRKMNIYTYPVLSEEEKMEEKINTIDFDFIPDIVVITGHDLFSGGNKKDLNEYINSKYFVKSVKAARKKYPNSVIIAGACQSNFEALIASGANFASSPKRVNVHIYDPAIIAIFVSITSFRKIVNYLDMEKHIVEIKGSFGGIETFGKMKMLY